MGSSWSWRLSLYARLASILAVLSQDELLEFEHMLETAPEVYDYCANMTDEQLNHLIAFISRNKENIFLELRHAKNDRDEMARALEEKERILAEKVAALAENESELSRKDRVIREKNKSLAKRVKKISDLEERLEELKDDS